MPKPKGTVTGPQFEILQILWDSDGAMSVVEVWEQVKKQRDVSRTTVLNLIDRLEKRNWLSREKIGGVFRYQAKVERDATEHMLADHFLGDFFDGSPGNFLLSLLGNRGVSKAEVKRLKKLLDESTENGKSKTKKGSK